ncbi:MAG: DNA replication and repair protein RecF [Bifidobacteriaceae bacterium]|nr:DNA replication and repair protein RecF [Bifidobacteriaceae bacterium]
MQISRLALTHFRSWDNVVLDFKKGINIIQGANGFGKTNLIEAIEILSTGYSHRTSKIQPVIQRGSNKATIRANYLDSLNQQNISDNNTNINSNEDGSSAAEKEAEDVFHNQDKNEQQSLENTHTLEANLFIKGANRGKIDNTQSVYFRDIVGKILCVCFAPDDQKIITDEPLLRRNFMNQAICSYEHDYEQKLQKFNHIAKQRVALLKILHDNSAQDVNSVLTNLEIWTGQFVLASIEISRCRQHFIEQLQKHFIHIYHQLSGKKENIQLQFVPSMSEILEYEHPQDAISQHLQQLYAGEVATMRNLIGSHRDDFMITLDGVSAKEYASNGEIWTMALSLKMALYELLQIKNNGVKPIVILDDVFAQLDENRREQILYFAKEQDQVIITVAAFSDIPNDLVDQAYIIPVKGVVQDENFSSFEDEIKKIQQKRSS